PVARRVRAACSAAAASSVNVRRTSSSTSASPPANSRAARVTMAGRVSGRSVTAPKVSSGSMFETLQVERTGPVGWLVFDRPAVGNAMNATMMRELEDAWRALADDDDVHVVVNTGNGDVFQTGLDVVELARDRDALREQSRRTRDFTLKLTAWHNDVWKPVIAAVNGTCAGGGLHFVADADIVLMSTTAALVDPHVSIGQATVFETIALAKK